MYTSYEKLIEPCCCKLIDCSNRISTPLLFGYMWTERERETERINCAHKKNFILMSISFNWSSTFVVFRTSMRLLIWTELGDTFTYDFLLFSPAKADTFPLVEPKSLMLENAERANKLQLLRASVEAIVLWWLLICYNHNGKPTRHPHGIVPFVKLQKQTPILRNYAKIYIWKKKLQTCSIRVTTLRLCVLLACVL